MIYLYHIRKCGGRSLIYSMLGREGNPDELYAKVCENKLMVNSKWFYGWIYYPPPHAYFAWSHEPYDTPVVLPPGTFTITILRDPFMRVVSYYAMLRMYESGALGASSTLPIEKQWLGDNLLQFIHVAPRQRILRQLFMFSKSFDVDEAAQRISNLSHYFRVEDYGVGLAALSQKLGFELREYKIDDPRQSDDIRNRIAIELPQAQDELYEMLEPEYELLRILE